MPRSHPVSLCDELSALYAKFYGLHRYLQVLLCSQISHKYE